MIPEQSPITTADTASTNATPAPRVPARRPDTRQLHVRVSPTERRAIETAATAAGFASAGRYLVACSTERRREADLIDAMAARVSGEIQSAVNAALGALADRLAADLSAVSAAVADRPTVGQMQRFLDVYRAAAVKATGVKPTATIIGSK